MSNVQYLQESICLELKIGDKTCSFLSLYKSPSQSQDNFKTFTENHELNLDNLVQRNLLLVVAIGDFNVKSSNWFFQDKTNFEGDAIENLASQFGLHQIIKEPTHILDTSSLYWPNLCVTAKLDNWVWSSFISTSKLSSSDNFCKI